MQDFLGALLIPTERPPAELDIKRALLAFDQVHINAPGDREFVDPAAFSQLLRPMPPFIRFAGGPVLPLGKVAGYDESFERLHDELKGAIADGFVVVREEPTLIMNTVGIFGLPPPPSSWADTEFLINNLLDLVTDKTALVRAAKGIGSTRELQDQDIEALAPSGRVFTDMPLAKLPNLADGTTPEHIAAAVTRLAVARFASVVKCIGISELGGLFPLATTSATVDVLDVIHARATESLSKVIADQTDDDLHFRRAMRAERVVFEEIGSELALAQMPFANVIKLRSGKNWERASVARRAFLAAVRKYSCESETDADFDRAVTEAIRAYDKSASDAKHERKQLGMTVGIPSLKSLLKGGAFTALLGVPSWELALPLAATLAILEEVREDALNAYRNHREKEKHPGKALVDIVPKAVRA